MRIGTLVLLLSVSVGVVIPATAQTAAFEVVIISNSPPPESVASDIEARMPEVLEKVRSAGTRSGVNHTRYRIQLMLAQGGDAPPHVLVSGVCEAHWPYVSDWNTRLVVVLDGGSCFFVVKYDPESQEFMDLVVNGEA